MSTLGSNIDDLNPEAPAPTAEVQPVRSASQPTTKARKVAPPTVGVKTKRIRLEDNDAIPPGGLFVQHNGKSYLIPVGVDVDVPVHVLKVVDDAVMSSPVIDPQTRRVRAWRERLRYPYQVVSG